MKQETNDNEMNNIVEQVEEREANITEVEEIDAVEKLEEEEKAEIVEFAIDDEGFATCDGKIEVYYTDNNNLYIGKQTEFIAKGTGLPANCYLDEPPPAKDGFVVMRQADKWTYIENHKGETVYNTETGEEIEITELGELPENVTTEPRPSQYHTFTKGKWTLSVTAKKQQLADVKDKRLNELNSLAENTVENLAKISKTPAFERATWEIQRQEAIAWKMDNNTATPSLDQIAKMRGVPAEILREKAYQKAIKYQQLTTTIAGIRQRYEDMIDTAKTLDALNKIEFVFDLGGGA